MRDGTATAAFHGAAVVFDGNFNSFKPFKSELEFVLSKKCRAVSYLFSGTPVAAYIKGVIPRALEQGRTVPIHAHLRMHKDTIETFLKIQRLFVDNPNVSFIVLNNTGHEQESYPATVDYLKDVKYDSPVLEAAIRRGWIMTSQKKESRNPSMKRRAELRAPKAVSSYHSVPTSTDKLALQICDEMISNLRFNVGEQKKRSSTSFSLLDI
jgi:hypothetical protein